MFKKVKKYYTAYANAYDFKNAMNFTVPKIYTAKGDLSKRWYVYYSFRHPETGKMIRQPPITMEINRNYKTIPERMKHLKILQKAVHDTLKEGYSPYSKTTSEDHYPAKKILLEILKIKEYSLKQSAIPDYSSRLNQFISFLEKKGLADTDIRKIDKKIVNEFLDNVLISTSARNRNNTKIVLSSLFTTLASKGYIELNFILSIENLKNNSKRDKTIKTDDLDRIIQRLEETDPLLLLYIEFVSYFFLRPIEVNRLTIGDVNISDKLISLEIKQKSYKTKIIPELVLEKLKFHIGTKTKTELLLFTPEGVGEWKTKEINRRDYFSKRFKKIKDELKLPEDYTLYSFRHTFITKVYKNLRKNHSKEESLSKLSMITGHESDAIHKYIHYIDAELPEDYSDLLK